MAMVCPQCNTPSETGIQCPKCHLGLLDLSLSSVETILPPRSVPWHQTSWGKIGAGVFLALGLSYSLVLLSGMAWQGLARIVGAGPLDPRVGLYLVAVLQGLVLGLVGALTGAGQRQGFAFGALVGLVSGGMWSIGILGGSLAGLVQPFCLAHLFLKTPWRPVVLYGLPAFHVLIGGLGALLGSILWKPPVLLSLPGAGSTPGTLLGGGASIYLPTLLPQGTWFTWAGPVNWIRILVGLAIGVGGGLLGSRPVVEFLVVASEGFLKIESRLQDELAMTVVFALSLLLGGCLAGATRPNGLKQGIIVGLGSALLILVLTLGHLVPSMTSLRTLLVLALLLGPLGGWFGTELLPPAYGPPRLRKSLDW